MNPRNPVILCVDDEEANLKLLANILVPRGYTVVSASSGEEALLKIKSQTIDLVLLDIIMPGMDGFEVCRQIKGVQKLRNIPVIMITALTAKQDRIRGIEAGAEEFLSRPFDQTEALARIKLLLKVKELNDDRERAEERIREIEHRHQVAESLGDILAALNSSRSLPELLGYIVNQASQMLAADAGSAFRIDQDRQVTVSEASNGLPSDLAALLTQPISYPEVAIRSLFNRKPMGIPNLSAYYRDLDGDESPVQDRDYSRLLSEHYLSGLIAPITIKDEVYGGLAFYYRERRDFSEEDLWLVVTFANQVALALENARLRQREEQAAVMAERNRLARDLHDAVTQTLFAASLIADVLPRLWERNPPEGRRRLEELRQLTRGALAEMRTLLLELRPTALVEAPLGDLLKQLAEAITGRARVPVAVMVEEPSRLPPEVQVALYRIAQEALNNVAKHARATQVTVLLRLCSEPAPIAAPLRVAEDKARRELSKELELRITDNGRGFASKSVPAEHLGLGIMRERAESIGATLTVDSQPGRGTQVVAVWRVQTKENKP